MANPNIKSPIWYGFGAAHYTRTPAAGTAYYVTDAANGGDDTNDGLTPNTAFLTITQALTQVTAGANDYIFVFRTTAASETWPIAMDTSYVHLIGTPDQATPTPLILPDEDAHGIVLTAGGCEIAGFNFGGTATDLKANIYCETAQWMNHIHHNFFAWSTESYDCIYLTGAPVQTRINDNYFGCHGFDRYGIYFSSGRINIEDNVFFQEGRIVSGTSAIFGSTDFGGVIRNNVFRCLDSAAGEAITVGGTGLLITGNYAMEGVAATMGNIPFQEDGTNHWGLNYENQTARLPT